MRKKISVGVVGVAAVLVGWVGLVPHGASSQALSCPSALGAGCGVVDPVIGAACYSDLPPVPTILFITISSEGRVVSCPDL